MKLRDEFIINTPEIIWALGEARKVNGTLEIDPVTGRMFILLSKKYGKTTKLPVSNYNEYLTPAPLFSKDIVQGNSGTGFKDKNSKNDGQTKPVTRSNRERESAIEFAKILLEEFGVPSAYKQCRFGTIYRYDTSNYSVYANAANNILEIVYNGIPLLETNFWVDFLPEK